MPQHPFTHLTPTGRFDQYPTDTTSQDWADPFWFRVLGDYSFSDNLHASAYSYQGSYAKTEHTSSFKPAEWWKSPFVRTLRDLRGVGRTLQDLGRHLTGQVPGPASTATFSGYSPAGAAIGWTSLAVEALSEDEAEKRAIAEELGYDEETIAELNRYRVGDIVDIEVVHAYVPRKGARLIEEGVGIAYPTAGFWTSLARLVGVD